MEFQCLQNPIENLRIRVESIRNHSTKSCSFLAWSGAKAYQRAGLPTFGAVVFVVLVVISIKRWKCLSLRSSLLPTNGKARWVPKQEDQEHLTLRPEIFVKSWRIGSTALQKSRPDFTCTSVTQSDPKRTLRHSHHVHARFIEFSNVSKYSFHPILLLCIIFEFFITLTLCRTFSLPPSDSPPPSLEKERLRIQQTLSGNLMMNF